MDQEPDLTRAEECSGCKFFHPYFKSGACRRYPPGPPAPTSLLWALTEINWFVSGEAETLNSHQFDPEGQTADDNDRSQFPQVHTDDWCGEFVRKAPNDQA